MIQKESWGLVGQGLGWLLGSIPTILNFIPTQSQQDMYCKTAFKKYSACWVIEAICICVFSIWYTGMSYLVSLNPMLFKIWHKLGLLSTFDTRECHISYPWIPYFSKILHMMGVLSTLYLCICVVVYFTFDTWECHIWYLWIPCFSLVGSF